MISPTTSRSIQARSAGPVPWRARPIIILARADSRVMSPAEMAPAAAAADAGVVSGGDMTREAGIAKLMVGMARYGTGAELRAWIEKDVVGERTA